MRAYLLFHSLAELVSATISFGTFLFAWNTRRFQNVYLQTVGAGALFVGVFETLHCLAFPGMVVFDGYDANLSPQLWLSARVFQVSATVGGLLWFRRAPRMTCLLGAFGIAFVAVCAAVFSRTIPELVIQGGGLTTFKIAAEWSLAAAFLGSAAMLLRVRDSFSEYVLRLLVAHGVTMAVCEICFTLYTRPYDIGNLLGHVVLLSGGTLQYMAILRAGLLDPTEAHFRELSDAKHRLERDVAERGAAEAREHELRQQAEQHAAELNAVFDSLADPLIVTDTAGNLVRANPAVSRMFGTSGDWRAVGATEHAAGQGTPTAAGEPAIPAHSAGARALAGETVHGLVQRFPLADGTELHLATSSAPIRTKSGIIGAVVAFTDVTERVRAEQTLREADRHKNEFLAVLSHELRNPLAPIRNGLHILERAAPGSDQARRSQSIIRRQVEQLARLVDDLLDITRISRNKIHLKCERLELNELVRRTVEDHRSLLENAQLHLDVALVDTPIPVHGDWPRLTQVIGNLLQNAVKFTLPDGHVTVSTTLVPGDDAVEIRVVDTGMGMAPEVLARLFQPFVQADSTLERSRGGLGLGLALVKALVELHHGEVRVASAGLGQGSEFTVRLPTEASAPAALTIPRDAATVPRRRVLVIEDNVDAAESLREVLGFEDQDVEVAYNGPDGIEKARTFAPDIVLCDIGLPGMDGYGVARAFRADHALRHIPLVALSGYALPEDLQRAASAGFQQHLAKPPSLDALAKVLAAVSARALRERAGVQASSDE